MRNLSTIRGTIRQLLRDEFEEEDYEFADDELDIHISEVLVEISQRNPYEYKETVESDGTREIDLSDLDLIGDKVVLVEYPTGNYPPSELKFTIFGDTLTLESEPTSGEDVYLYCHEVHQLTEAASTLSPDLEGILIKGVVAKAAMAFLNSMRAQIVPSTYRWYHEWATQQFAIYQNGLNSITRPKVWDFS
jgi:hypothetical protein